MDLEKEILKEHSKAQCARIVRYINGDPVRFRKLMKLFFTGEYRVVQRASWPISYCIQEKPALIKPYYKQLLHLMQQPGVHQSVVRNGVRLLQYVQVPAAYQGQVMNLCFNFIENPQTPAAIKAFSLTVLERLSFNTRKYFLS